MEGKANTTKHQALSSEALEHLTSLVWHHDVWHMKVALTACAQVCVCVKDILSLHLVILACSLWSWGNVFLCIFPYISTKVFSGFISDLGSGQGAAVPLWCGGVRLTVFLLFFLLLLHPSTGFAETTQYAWWGEQKERGSHQHDDAHSYQNTYNLEEDTEAYQWFVKFRFFIYN